MGSYYTLANTLILSLLFSQALANFHVVNIIETKTTSIPRVKQPPQVTVTHKNFTAYMPSNQYGCAWFESNRQSTDYSVYPPITLADGSISDITNPPTLNASIAICGVQGLLIRQSSSQYIVTDPSGNNVGTCYDASQGVSEPCVNTNGLYMVFQDVFWCDTYACKGIL
jgi:hypothetical protein